MFLDLIPSIDGQCYHGQDTRFWRRTFRSMEYVKASRFSVPELTQIWNAGYTGYFVPVEFTEQMVTNWFRCGDIDLDRSLVAMDGQTPAAFSLLGVRGDRGWIGGFGVAPAYRGQGLAYRLFAEHAARFDLRTVQLEVLTENWARKVYEKAGFAVTRRLSILSGKLPAGSGAAVQEAAPADVLAHSARLHAACPAVWQREPDWIRKALPAGARAVYTGPSAAPMGFAVFAATGESLRLLDAIATDEDAAAGLVGALGAVAPGAALSAVNEPEGGPVHRALSAVGCSEARAQYEMRWQRA